MHAHAQLITDFYDAFSRRDAEAMAACYADEVVFRDPVFDLRGARAGDMWRMLCERGKDLKIEVSGISADDVQGAAHWEAHYTFSATGRMVHNIIDARFRFKDGKIVEHTDTFDLWRWSGLALGIKGKLLGWTPFVQSAIQKQGAKGLDQWIKRRAAAS